MDLYISIFMRLSISALIGSIIGLERESSNRPAGFRTHILVTMGSALIMIVSTMTYDPLIYHNDPMRLAAQVVSGMGFLGAGTIIRDGATVKGLTTAASLWVCGGIGLAIGSGQYFAGITTSLIAVIALTILNKVERKYIVGRIKPSFSKYDSSFMKIHLIRESDSSVVSDINSILANYKLLIKNLYVINDENLEVIEDYSSLEGLVEIMIYVDKEDKKSNVKYIYKCMDEISQLEGIKEIDFEL